MKLFLGLTLTELTGFLATDGGVRIRGHNSLLKERDISLLTERPGAGGAGSPKTEGEGKKGGRWLPAGWLTGALCRCFPAQLIRGRQHYAN